MNAYVKTVNHFRKLQQRRIAMQRKPLAGAAALVMTIARRSVKVTDKEAPPGKPPSSPTGKFRRAIMFAVEAPVAVIGPSADIVGNVGKAHEKGGDFRDETYPERPTMGPALQTAGPRVSSFWTNSL